MAAHLAINPGLAASATLGLQIKNHSTAKRLRHFLEEWKTVATALRLDSTNSYPGLPKRPTLGWRAQPRCGSPKGSTRLEL